MFFLSNAPSSRSTVWVNSALSGSPAPSTGDLFGRSDLDVPNQAEHLHGPNEGEVGTVGAIPLGEHEVLVMVLVFGLANDDAKVRVEEIQH